MAPEIIDLMDNIQTITMMCGGDHEIEYFAEVLRSVLVVFMTVFHFKNDPVTIQQALMFLYLITRTDVCDDQHGAHDEPPFDDILMVCSKKFQTLLMRISAGNVLKLAVLVTHNTDDHEGGSDKTVRLLGFCSLMLLTVPSFSGFFFFLKKRKIGVSNIHISFLPYPHYDDR